MHPPCLHNQASRHKELLTASQTQGTRPKHNHGQLDTGCTIRGKPWNEQGDADGRGHEHGNERGKQTHKRGIGRVHGRWLRGAALRPAASATYSRQERRRSVSTAQREHPHNQPSENQQRQWRMRWIWHCGTHRYMMSGSLSGPSTQRMVITHGTTVFH